MNFPLPKTRRGERRKDSTRTTATREDQLLQDLSDAYVTRAKAHDEGDWFTFWNQQKEIARLKREMRGA